MPDCEAQKKRQFKSKFCPAERYQRDEENEQVLITHIKVRDGTLEQNTVSQVGNQEHLYEHYQQTTLSVIPPPIQFLDLLIILRHNSVLPQYLHIDFFHSSIYYSS